jgi:hypothetical protein
MPANTSMAVANAGSERAWVSMPMKRGPVMSFDFLYSQMAWLMARIWSSLKLLLKEDPL